MKQELIKIARYLLNFFLILRRDPKAAFKRARNLIFWMKLRHLLHGANHTTKIKSLSKSENNFHSPNLLIALHLYYTDLAEEFFESLENWGHEFTLLITMPKQNSKTLKLFENLSCCKEVIFVQTKNIGRDIYPFLRAMESINLDTFDLICKIHAKKSPHRKDGAKWRKELIQNLLDPSKIKKMSSEKFNNSKLGIIGPEQFLQKKEGSRYNAFWIYKLLKGINYKADDVPFFAGTMFWITPMAVSELLSFERKFINYSDPNSYQPDGLIEHGFERCITPVLINKDMDIFLI